MQRSLTFILLLLSITGLFILSLLYGAVEIPAGDVAAILLGEETGRTAWRYIIIENRLPQGITALLAGGALAVTGLMLQTAFRNNLAGPGIFGISSGASLGVALVILLPATGVELASSDSIFGFLGTTTAAFIGAMAVMGIIMLLSLTINNNNMLLIAGIMTGYLASSAISLLNMMSDATGVQSYMLWGLGSFSGVTLRQLPYFAGGCIVGTLATLLLMKPLNIMLLGDNYTRNLGISPIRMRNIMLLLTGWLTAVVTAHCGPISFIGLAVPHIARMAMRTDDHRVLIPATIGFGCAIGLLCNIICSLPGDSGLLPLNAVTPLIGAPVIIYVLLRHVR